MSDELKMPDTEALAALIGYHRHEGRYLDVANGVGDSDTAEYAAMALATADALAAAEARIKKLEAALEFYAKWPEPDDVGGYGIHDDTGAVARAALTVK